MVFIDEFKKPAEWESFITPLTRAVAGEDVPYNLDNLWRKDDDDRSALDSWRDGWAGREEDPETREDPEFNLPEGAAPPGKEKAGRAGGPEVTGQPGNFDILAWQQSVENGKISESALAKVGNGGFLMNPYAAAALDAMIQAARADGVRLSIGNTYRNYATQSALYQDYKNGERSAPAAAPGTSNHGWGLAVDLEAIEYGGEQWNWLRANAARFGYSNPFSDPSTEPWHWEYGQSKGSTPDFTSGGAPTTKPTKKVTRTPIEHNSALAPLSLADGPPALSTVLAEIFMPDTVKQVSYTQGEAPSFSGANGRVERQLYQGFMDAGRPDLAQMVGTKDFNTWINAESGWNVGSVSQYYAGHGRNYGLFQFAQIHPWTKDYLSGGEWTASPYEQAKLVVKYFNLKPDEISQYAQQIRNGDYSGWG